MEKKQSLSIGITSGLRYILTIRSKNVIKVKQKKKIPSDVFSLNESLIESLDVIPYTTQTG